MTRLRQASAEGHIQRHHQRKTAAEDACRVEHYISDTTFDAIKAHMKKHGA